ncbi:helicase C-terminal domain-containing protein [Trichlorobacter ammonificans]|uniref:DNA 5'-3' helicase n=1 Tax=Trichlorobacter ammonificans TaxID=2916410 RepID=A0ABM9D686_9BACT|nr:helicase C-terminal domain-containing protein [Trichlorobacter ammonificans]CAH2030242.1 DinG family ATP-dependent helicase YoaA [Trichlorobacter ammonificans]
MILSFSPDCRALIRHEIEQANHNEVFFIADCDATGCVTAVEAVARGGRTAVPAIISRAVAGQVVLHNHPSGDLTPSDADLDIASITGNNGIGFAIIDNQCADCYLVVAPHLPRERELIAGDELARAFGADGVLARHLKGYEEREEQVRMAQAVAAAFNGDGVAMIEAGTGTGKSLAYLIPAVLWAVRNEQRVVISTNTINLQEQLIKKDIPLLQRHSTVTFSACLVKGRGNYLCKRKLEAAVAEPALFPDAATEELNALAAWNETSQSGCLSDLSFHPSWEVWDDLRCEADQCSRSRCAHFQKCFFYRARREAATARILVVNHALLLADIALRRESGYDAVAILPPFTRLIVDEGHHLEEAATGALSVRISRSGLMRHLARLAPAGGRSGILAVLNNRLGRELPEHLDGLYQELSAIVEGALLPQTLELAGILDRELDWLAQALQEELAGDDLRGSEVRRRITPAVRQTPFWTGLAPRLTGLAEKLAELAAGLGALDRAAAKLPDPVRQALDGWLTDAVGIGRRLATTSDELLGFCGEDEEVCRWLELKKSGRGMQAAICSAPLEVAATIHGALLEPIPTVVLTSATMTVGGSFGYQRRRTGLDLLEPARLSELALPSPFNFAEQSVVGIPNDLPDPATPAYRQALADAVLRAVALSRGGAFVLFTSFDLLRQTWSALKGDLERLGLTVLRQGEGGGRHQLLARFRKERHAVLFGTDSFWEGVDVKGDALRLVIIARLPFQVPTEPIQQARAERVTRQGGDPFRELSLPQAVLKLRQGFGRLIRSRDDHGAVLILDSRIVTKNYGSRFLKSLPASAQVIAPAERVFGRLEEFFNGMGLRSA